MGLGLEPLPAVSGLQGKTRSKARRAASRILAKSTGWKVVPGPGLEPLPAVSGRQGKTRSKARRAASRILAKSTGWKVVGLGPEPLPAVSGRQGKTSSKARRAASRILAKSTGWKVVPGPGLEPGFQAPKARVLPIALPRNGAKSVADRSTSAQSLLDRFKTKDRLSRPRRFVRAGTLTC